MAGFSFGNFKLHACFRPTTSSKWNHEQPASRISNNVLQSSISQKHCICLEVFKDADPSTPLGYWFSNPAAHRSHLDRSLRSARCELRDRMRTERKQGWMRHVFQILVTAWCRYYVTTCQTQRDLDTDNESTEIQAYQRETGKEDRDSALLESLPETTARDTQEKKEADGCFLLESAVVTSAKCHPWHCSSYPWLCTRSSTRADELVQDRKSVTFVPNTIRTAYAQPREIAIRRD